MSFFNEFIKCQKSIYKIKKVKVEFEIIVLILTIYWDNKWRIVIYLDNLKDHLPSRQKKRNSKDNDEFEINYSNNK